MAADEGNVNHHWIIFKPFTAFARNKGPLFSEAAGHLLSFKNIRYLFLNNFFVQRFDPFFYKFFVFKKFQPWE